MQLENYTQFDGLHWQTGYVRNALAYQGVVAPHTGQPYSEAMLMGICGGICAGYFAFEYEGHLPHLHFLTRYLFDEQVGPVFERLNMPMKVQQTTDPQKAVANVVNALAGGKPVIAWVDVMSLGYNSPVLIDGYWMVMPVLVYGIDLESETVHLADRACVPLTASTDQFAAGRARIGKTRHRIMTFDGPDASRLPSAIEAGIRDCIQIFTAKPPVSTAENFGFKAYEKWAHLLQDTKNKKSWARMFAPGARMVAGLTSTYRFLELYFTGGRGARDMYADFLDEAAVVLNTPALRDSAAQFRVAADRWGDLAAATLPDEIAPFAEMRQLMRRDYDLFLSQGTDSIPERRTIHGQLEALKTASGADFPLSEAEAARHRARMRDYVLAISEAEKVAIGILAESMGVKV